MFTGIACSAVVLSLQLWGQRRIPPTRAALILLVEPVFAGLAGYVDGERLGAVELVGGVVILAGIAIVRAGPRTSGADRAADRDKVQSSEERRPHCRSETTSGSSSGRARTESARGSSCAARAPRRLGRRDAPSPR